MLDQVKDLLGHCAWADAVFFRAWGKGDREDLELRERMSHSSGVQENFLDTLRGGNEPPWEEILKGQVKPPWVGRPLRSYEELKDWTRSNHARLRDLAGALDAPALERRVTIPWFADPPCVVSAAEALVQLAMHTQHHRGQNIARLRQIGGEPKNVDFIIWLWKERPAAVWD